ncbi:MAG: hypothetical protein OXP09_14705 [Gammaproteobacteria bacterium]|nr:hypothetical protein [Gammaproteobacteria bacterium]
MTVPSFVITVEKAQYREGFVNVPGVHSHHFAADGALVEVRLPGSRVPVKATVSRRANLNRTPRIVGGVRLRDWFQQTIRVGDMIRVRVENSAYIEIVTFRPRTRVTGRRPAAANTTAQESCGAWQ